MRVIARRERAHPGAQLRLTDADGWRITLFATNAVGGRIAELEMTHRLRARAEDRIRCLKDTGLRNLPLHDFAANQIWLELVALAADLLAWTQHLALDRHRGPTPGPKTPTATALLSCRPASCAPAAANGSDYHAAGPGTITCSPHSPGSTPSRPEPASTPTTRTGHPRQTRRSTAPTSETPPTPAAQAAARPHERSRLVVGRAPGA